MSNTIASSVSQRRTKAATSFRLSETALDLLSELSKDTGQSQVGVIELALRDLAKARKTGGSPEGLVGSSFHNHNDKGGIRNQGRVLSEVAPGKYLIQFYSFFGR